MREVPPCTKSQPLVDLAQIELTEGGAKSASLFGSNVAAPFTVITPLAAKTRPPVEVSGPTVLGAWVPSSSALVT